MADDMYSCSGVSGSGLDVVIWIPGDDRSKQKCSSIKSEATQLLCGLF